MAGRVVSEREPAVPEINPVSLGFEIGILAGLAVQCILLGLIVSVILVARRRGAGTWLRAAFLFLLVLVPVACMWVSHQCLQYRDYIRSQSDDPIATDKLAQANASLGPAMIGSVALCVVTFAGSCAVARFGRFPPPRTSPLEGSDK
jgi:hypothetical protein